MARPPVEWPIPAYVVDFRERLVLTFRLRGRDVSRLAPSPVAPYTLHGEGVVSLCLSNGRRLKSVGGIPVLASDFRTAELLTPVRWQPACRSAMQGLCWLRFFSNSHGLVRLARTGLELAAEVADETLLRGAARPGAEPEWPADSLFDSTEHAEGALLHPEWCFAPDRLDRLVRAIPVHHYARSTVHVAPEQTHLDRVARLLEVEPHALRFDHALLQKRCTHTVSFPPETIVRTRPSVARGALGRPVALAA
jgi:hypothetical protein